jgi:hypothetical protein
MRMSMTTMALAPRSFILLSVAVIATSGPADCATTESAATNPPPPESALWPARFPRTLMSANDVKAAKARSAARPNKFDLLPWQTPIKNQGKRDTCYAFAFTAGLEAAYRHKYGKVVDGRYQGPQWFLSEEFLIHAAKSTLLNRPQTYLFENPSSYWEGVLGVVGYPMMISVLSEQLMNYRIPETQHAPYVGLDNPAPNTPPGLTQLAVVNNCAVVGKLVQNWVDKPPQVDRAGHCTGGNCATQQAVDACEYAPDYIPAAASRNARFGVSFSLTASDSTEQPGAKALSKAQMSDTDLLESLLFEGHEVVSELYLNWKRGQQINTAYQSSPLWEYDATVKGDGHNMLLVGYDRSDPSPSRWYFIMKNSWGGEKYYFVSYEFMRRATRGGVILLDVVDPAIDQPVSLLRGGAWLGSWPIHRGEQSDLDGSLVVRRTFDPNVPVQPKPGTDLDLGQYYPANGASAQRVLGHALSDSTIMFHLEPDAGTTKSPPKPGTANAAIYTWTFGADPTNARAK